MGFLSCAVIRECLNTEGKRANVKGFVNDVSECRYNCRRNSLKEMRWNRIKRTSSRIIRKVDHYCHNIFYNIFVENLICILCLSGLFDPST